MRQLSQNLFLKCSLPGTNWGGHAPLLNGAPQHAEQDFGAGPFPTPANMARRQAAAKNRTTRHEISISAVTFNVLLQR